MYSGALRCQGRAGVPHACKLPSRVGSGLQCGTNGGIRVTNGSEDRALEAFRRLLAEGNQGGQAKVDALVALAQRTVWVAIWGAAQEGFRTLTNSDGNTALPVFTSAQLLEEAGVKFGWLAPDGSALGREVGARQALRHCIAHNLQYVVVDIGSDHELEIERAEIEPLMTPEARRDSTIGPYAGVGRVSSSMMKAVKATPPPGSLPAHKPTPPPGTLKAPVTEAARPQPPPSEPRRPPSQPRIQATTADATAGPPATTFGSGSSVTMGGLTTEPPEALLDALSELYRGYPEVEWACMGSVSRGPADAVPTVGIRVDTAFRQRVNEIIQRTRQTADEQGAAVDVILLDDPQVMRTARQVALVFYPWRR